MNNIISTADAFRVLDGLEQARGPRVYRVKFWGHAHESSLVAYSVTDARRRSMEIDRSLRIVSIVETGQ